MARRTSIVAIGPNRRGSADRVAYGADRPGAAGSRVGVTKPSRSARKARRRR